MEEGGDIDSADGARGREKTRSLITISEGDTRTEIRRETATEDDTHTARQPGKVESKLERKCR